MSRVIFHFDFISPYSYLALARAEAFGREQGIEWELRPVVYAKLLESHGLVGPVETEAKRAYTFADVLRSASVAGVPLVGPPAHPFRSLAALRLATLHREDERGLELCVRLAAAAWAEGRDISDLGVLEQLRSGCGFRGDALEDELRDDGVQAALRDATGEAVHAGVFGVPSFRVGQELFWGHDRLEHLAQYLDGRLPSMRDERQALLERPQAVRRRDRR